MDENEHSIQQQIAWLERASPDDWHRAVLDFNWDWNIDPLFWIARQPQCDKATALTMFWLGQPAWYLLMALENGGSDANRDPVWDMLKLIAQRINARSYVRSKIAYDVDDFTRQDFDELVEKAGQLAHPPLEPHPDMKRSLRGLRIVNDVGFYGRYPKEFHGTVLIELPDQEPPESQGPLDRIRSAFGRLWLH
ncbi:MAG: DUF4274 domain-containing protein [Mesorhizobium sp.]|nr:DUF4274 domain-containing protein [Mesorhizobium sp.]